jgi:hypothetical protein
VLDVEHGCRILSPAQYLVFTAPHLSRLLHVLLYNDRLSGRVKNIDCIIQGARKIQLTTVVITIMILGQKLGEGRY